MNRPAAPESIENVVLDRDPVGILHIDAMIVVLVVLGSRGAPLLPGREAADMVPHIPVESHPPGTGSDGGAGSTIARVGAVAPDVMHVVPDDRDVVHPAAIKIESVLP